MSNLLGDPEGQATVDVIEDFLIRRRIARFLKRNFVVAFQDYCDTGTFKQEILLGELNEAHDPELRKLFQLLEESGGSTEVISTAPLNLWVDSGAGDDDTGDGTQAKPYKTLFFLKSLPRRIAHPYKIMLIGDVVYNDHLTLDFTFSDLGSLSFIGVGFPAQVLAPQAIQTTAVLVGFDSARFIRVPLVPWSNNQWQDDWIQIMDGTDAGKAVSVHTNGPNTCYFRGRVLPGMSNGDSFRMVRPVNKLSVKSLTSVCNGPSALTADKRGSGRIGFYNLIIELDEAQGGPKNATFVINNRCGMNFSFCTVRHYDVGIPEIIIESPVNEFNPLDEEISMFAACGVTNLTDPYDGGYQNHRQAGLAVRSGNSNEYVLTTIIEDARKVLCIDFVNLVEAKGTVDFRHNAVGALAVRGNCHVWELLCTGTNYPGVWAGISILQGQVDIEGFVVLGPSTACIAVYRGQGSFVLRGNGGGADPVESSGILFGVQSEGDITGRLEVNPQYLTGTSGDWRQETMNPAVTVAWPIPYGFEKDGLGLIQKGSKITRGAL